MEANNLARLFGSCGYITKNTQERSTFDMEKLRPILEEAGKWKDILEPDSKKLETLLPHLPPNIQKQIMATRETKTVTTLKQTKKKA
jgi:hypothetical protein